jgi:hypothetical protein
MNPGYLAYTPSIIAGFLLAHLMWPLKGWIAFLFKLSLGIGLGLGINSILYFSSLITKTSPYYTAGFQLIIIVVLLLIIFRNQQGKPSYSIEHDRFILIQYILLGAVAISFTISFISFAKVYRNRPEGAFDAWTIWNRSARFIYRDPENWQSAISTEFSWENHVDYPLLIPLNVAWGWRAVGAETQHIPVMQGALFLVASIGVIFSSIAYLRTVGQGSLAALVFMGSPIFIEISAVQIADVPVMYFILSSSILLYMYFKYKAKNILILSGLLAGLAGWTKNEGLLFILICPITLILVDYKNSFRHLKTFFTGLIVPLLIIIYFKSLSPPVDLLLGSTSVTLMKIADLSRYSTILRGFYLQSVNFNGWPFNMWLFFIIYAMVMQIRQPQDSLNEVAPLFIIVLFQLAGYTLIFVTTPYDLDWHIKTAMYRLLLHIYPVIYFIYFICVNPPETLLPYKK